MTTIIAAAVAGILTLISGVLVAIINSQLKQVKEELAKTVSYQKDNYMALLRLTVMNSEMPIDERIAAGKNYIDHGGNGGVKEYYHNNLVKEHIK